MGKITGRPGPDPSGEHGTRSRYQGTPIQPGCRCTDCRDANAVYVRNWYEKNENYKRRVRIKEG